MTLNIDCFKAYDIRGQIPNQLNPDVAYRVGNATAEYLQAKRVVVGRDIRLSSAELPDAVCKGLIEAGAEVLDIGLCGTEMVYFATDHLNADGGIIDKDLPFDASNVMFVHGGETVRLGYKVNDDGTKVRIARPSGDEV